MTLIVLSKRPNLFRSFHLAIISLLLCVISPYSQPSPTQSVSRDAIGQSAIIVQTELVLLPVSVTNAKGTFISGLTAQNFRVYEDGRLQTVTSFHDENIPVTVGLIVDHSRSMGPKLSEVAVSISNFAKSSNPQDEMFVVDFNDDVSVELLNGKPFTNNVRELEKAISAVSARGKTALYDAVVEGLVHVQLGHWDKKALIIVSDGGDNASQQQLSQVLALAQRSQVVIYSIGLLNANEEENPAVLRRLSKNTGGIAYFPTSLGSVADISQKIARDLREQYTLGFVPEKTNATNSIRHIRVEVDNPGLGKVHVRTRPGYLRADPKSAPAKSGKSAS